MLAPVWALPTADSSVMLGCHGGFRSNVNSPLTLALSAMLSGHGGFGSSTDLPLALAKDLSPAMLGSHSDSQART